MSEEIVFDEAVEWVRENCGSISGEGFDVRIYWPRGDRSNRSISVSVDCADMIGQLIFWESGDAQLMRGDAGSDFDEDRTLRIRSFRDFRQAFDELVSWAARGRGKGRDLSR
jgi:hypothetical protein